MTDMQCVGVSMINIFERKKEKVSWWLVVKWVSVLINKKRQRVNKGLGVQVWKDEWVSEWVSELLPLWEICTTSDPLGVRKWMNEWVSHTFVWDGYTRSWFDSISEWVAFVIESQSGKWVIVQVNDWIYGRKWSKFIYLQLINQWVSDWVCEWWRKIYLCGRMWDV
jgi:hypothetical protein